MPHAAPQIKSSLAFRLPARTALLARLILLTFAFGMFLDIVTGLFAVQPFWFRPEYLGSIDGVRIRMLRLAQVAAIALPVLAGRHHDLARKAPPNDLWVRRAHIAMIGGMIGMPVVFGGLHATVMAAEVACHADAVVVGASRSVTRFIAPGFRRRLPVHELLAQKSLGLRIAFAPGGRCTFLPGIENTRLSAF